MISGDRLHVGSSGGDLGSRFDFVSVTTTEWILKQDILSGVDISSSLYISLSLRISSSFTSCRRSPFYSYHTLDPSLLSPGQPIHWLLVSRKIFPRQPASSVTFHPHSTTLSRGKRRDRPSMTSLSYFLKMDSLKMDFEVY